MGTLLPLLSDSDDETSTTRKDEEGYLLDPDRPPISTRDKRKIKNQIKSKAKKTPEEIAKIRDE